MKYKKCCLVAPKVVAQPRPAQQAMPSVRQEVEKIQQTAKEGKELVRPLGVFILVSTVAGDAWLLEATDMDGVQVAEAGSPIDIEIVEGAETIELNWTHRFAIKNKKFVTTAYKDNAEKFHDKYPSQAIHATLGKIMKKIPPEMLKNIHITEDDATSIITS
jgi:hypothetical protein